MQGSGADAATDITLLPRDTVDIFSRLRRSSVRDTKGKLPATLTFGVVVKLTSVSVTSIVWSVAANL
jgi:hypothetical protein